MAKPVHPMWQGTTWVGFCALLVVLYFWFHRAASIPVWKHLVFGGVLGLVALLQVATWRRSIAALKEANKEAHEEQASKE